MDSGVIAHGQGNSELLKTIQLPKNLKNLSQRLPKAQYDDVLDPVDRKKDLPISGASFNPQEPDADGAAKGMHRNLSL